MSLERRGAHTYRVVVIGHINSFTLRQTVDSLHNDGMGRGDGGGDHDGLNNRELHI